MLLTACGSGGAFSAGSGSDGGGGSGSGGGGHGGGGSQGGGPPGPAPIADEPVPAGARYVATNGNDAAAGTLAAPWRTVGRGLAALQPGDTLVLRGGTYFEHDLPVALAGTQQAPITIRNHPGERPVVDAGLTQFRSSNNQDWTLVDQGRQIWRSVATFAGAGQVYGQLADHDGGHRLIPYERYAALAADGEDYSESAEFYCGPGVFWQSSDQRIYVRLQPSRYHARTGCSAPTDRDPRRTAMVLWTEREVLDVRATAAWLQFRAVDLVHGEPALDLPAGSHHLTFRDCALLGGRYTVIVRGGAHDLLFDGIRVDGRFPPYVPRSDVKRPESGPPGHLLQDAALILEGAVTALTVQNSRFTGLFDAIDSNGAPSDLAVHHCEFTTIRDDVFEIATAGHHVDFHHNTVRRAAAAVSRNGSQAPPIGSAGTKYVHHNVLDTSTLQLYGRDDPQGLLPAKWRGPAGDGMATGLAFGTHDTSALNGPDPWRIYQNTIVGRADVDGEGFGIAYRFAPFTTAVPHEVHNNVFVQRGDQWIGRGARVDDGSQAFDGNIYHRAPSAPTTALFEDYAGSSTQRFQSLVQFTTSSLWLASRAHYAPGWEASGAETDPGLDDNYRPAPTGVTATVGVDLSARGWPDGEPLPYRGAVAPR